MNDALSWSLPIGRYFGINVRVHLTFFLIAIPAILRVYAKAPAYVLDAIAIQLLFFVSVLLHEFGHCFAARYVDGDADEILMWPLGGLASCQIPNTPRANFITTAGGPAVNVLLCFLSTGVLAIFGLIPSFNPLWHPIPTGREDALYNFASGQWVYDLSWLPLLFARLFFVNWLLFLFNMVLIGFPLDGGRLVQAFLWPRVGFVSATRFVIFTGNIIAVAIILLVLIFAEKDPVNSLLMFSLALFIYMSCRQQAILLETGGLMDDTFMGYDFSQGYTSLERGNAKSTQAKQPFWKRWLEKRAEAKKQREQQQFEADQSRVDELLAKVKEYGMQSLTPEEQRFLKRFSAKLKEKNRS